MEHGLLDANLIIHIFRLNKGYSSEIKSCSRKETIPSENRFHRDAPTWFHGILNDDAKHPKHVHLLSWVLRPMAHVCHKNDRTTNQAPAPRTRTETLAWNCFSNCVVGKRRRCKNTSSTAQGGGGSFKNRKTIGEIGCCESRMAERIHWWTERWLELCFLEWLQWLQWSPGSPHPQLLDVVV